MTLVSTQRLRVPLTPPQAVSHASAVLWEPGRDTGAPGLVLAPGAGSDLMNPVLRALGRGLAERGHPVVVFNFAYTEAGRRRPDPKVRLERAFEDAIAAATAQFGDRPVVLGGRSMGGRIASHLAARGRACLGLVFLGYPLHPQQRADVAGPISDERLRSHHWPDLRCPALFVQGDRDKLCDLDLLATQRRTRLTGAPSSLRVVAGADHGFGVRKKDGRDPADVLAEVVEVVGSWLGGLTHPSEATG